MTLQKNQWQQMNPMPVINFSLIQKREIQYVIHTPCKTFNAVNQMVAPCENVKSCPPKQEFPTAKNEKKISLIQGATFHIFTRLDERKFYKFFRSKQNFLLLNFSLPFYRSFLYFTCKFLHRFDSTQTPSSHLLNHKIKCPLNGEGGEGLVKGRI